MKSIFLPLTVLLFLFSCQKKEGFNEEEIFPMNDIASGKEYDSLYIEAIEKGNCDAFFELYKDMMEYADKSPILEFSKKTIQKDADCIPAQEAYFNALCRKYEIRDYYEYAGRDIRKMNKSDYDEAMKFLKMMLQNKYITQSEFDAVIK